MRSTTRRTLLRLAGGMPLLATLVLPASAQELEVVNFRLDWLPAGYHAPYYLAEAKGWFKKVGLDVRMSDGNGSATALQLVRTGEADVAAASLSSMAFAKNKGMPVISIAGFFRKGDLTLMVPADSPIKEPKDIKGKKILYTAASAETPFIDSFLSVAGLTRDDVQLLNVDATAKNVLYLNGSVDGVFTNATAVARVQDKRPARNILFADYGLSVPGFGLVTSLDTLKKKGTTLRKFASVISAAWTYTANGHEEEALKAMLKIREQSRLDVGVIGGQLHASLPFLFTEATKALPVGVQSDADWKSAIAILERAKLIGPNTHPSTYFTNDYLDLKLIDSLLKG